MREMGDVLDSAAVDAAQCVAAELQRARSELRQLQLKSNLALVRKDEELATMKQTLASVQAQLEEDMLNARESLGCLHELQSQLEAESEAKGRAEEEAALLRQRVATLEANQHRNKPASEAELEALIGDAERRLTEWEVT